MRKKFTNDTLVYLIGIITTIVWSVGFWGYWGIAHTIIVGGLIIIGLVVILIGIITRDDFL